MAVVTITKEEKQIEASKTHHQRELADTLWKWISNLEYMSQYRESWGDGLLDEFVLPEKDYDKIQTVNGFLLKCLISHLQGEFPKPNLTYLSASDLSDQFLHDLRLLAGRCIFNGTCEICDKWVVKAKDLPNFSTLINEYLEDIVPYTEEITRKGYKDKLKKVAKDFEDRLPIESSVDETYINRTFNKETST